MLAEQVVGPVDRAAERLLPGGCGSTAAGEEPEPLVEVVEDLEERDRPDAGRGQLDGQGDPVEPPAQPTQGLDFLLPDHEPVSGIGRAVEEQAHRIRAQHRVPGVVAGNRQRRDRRDPLTGDGQTFPTRREDSRSAGARQAVEHQRGGRRDQVLAIVEHDEHRTGGEEVGQRVLDRLAGLQLHAEDAAHRLGDHGRIRDPGELDEPRAVPVPGRDLGRDLQREPGLPDPSDPGERDQPRLLQSGDDPFDVVAASDEAGRLDRQVGREGVERAEGWEFVECIGDDELEHPLGLGQVPEPVLTEITERVGVADLGGIEQLGRCPRDEDLTAVTDRHEPCSSVHLGPEVVTVPVLGLAGVDAHAHRRERGRLECALCGARGVRSRRRDRRTRLRTRHHRSRT